MSLHIRSETEGDFDSITQVNDLAFGGPGEGRLVEALRDTAGFLSELSLVAELGGQLVGHILFYPVAVCSASSRYPLLALAPMSVRPGRQKQGIGSRLIEEGLRRAKGLGHRAVVLVGHPAYMTYGAVHRHGYAPLLPCNTQVFPQIRRNIRQHVGESVQQCFKVILVAFQFPEP